MKLAVALFVAILSTTAAADVFRPIDKPHGRAVNVNSEADLRMHFQEECARLQREEQARRAKKRADAANMLDLEGNFRPLTRPGVYTDTRRDPYLFYGRDGWSPLGNY